MRELCVANVTGSRALPHYPRVTQALWGLTPPRLQPISSSLYKLISEESTLEHALPLAFEHMLCWEGCSEPPLCCRCPP